MDINGTISGQMEHALHLLWTCK